MEHRVVFSPSTFDDYLGWLLLQDRKISVDCNLYDETATVICNQLEWLASQSQEPIHIIITCPGGSVFAAMAIYDTMLRVREEHQVPIIAEARGYAASAAAVIMQAADERLATEHTRLLIHEVSNIKVFERETVSDIEEEAEEMKKVNNMLVNILAERSGQSAEDIKKLWRKKDVWMSAQEAAEWGLIDEVI